MKKIALFGLLASASLSVSAHAATVSVYDGYYGSGNFTSFFTGAGETVNQITSSFSAADIAGSDLVILSALSGVSASQLADLSSYVNGGGRLVVQSDGAGFQQYQASLNTISAALGSSIVNLNTGFDGGFQNTTAIASNPFTAGVSTVNYAYTSSLTGGTNLVNGNSGQAFINYQGIGSGFFFAIADINTQNNLSVAGNDNGKLYLNFLNANALGTPEPGTWALMVLGFGAVGFAMRRRQSSMTVRYA